MALCADRYVRVALMGSFVLMSLVFGAQFVQAQFSGVGQATLVTNPSSPRPHTTTTMTLDAYVYDLDGATIRWFVDGGEITDARNQFSTEFETGDIGTQHQVRVDVTLADSTTVRVADTIIPRDVDIILEADTQVPSFYKGRALPSGGAKVRAIAVPLLESSRSMVNLSYRWQLGNEVLGGGAQRGGQTTTFTMPRAGTPLSVTVSDANGNELTKKTIIVAPATPEVYFYPINPLRGMSERAITNTFPLLEEEMSVRAETYYMDTTDAPDTKFAWTIDGAPVVNGNRDHRLITLRKTGSSGTANIGFSAVNPKKLGQIARGAFSIFFE